jgi:hypothetical protein
MTSYMEFAVQFPYFSSLYTYVTHVSFALRPRAPTLLTPCSTSTFHRGAHDACHVTCMHASQSPHLVPAPSRPLEYPQRSLLCSTTLHCTSPTPMWCHTSGLYTFNCNFSTTVHGTIHWTVHATPPISLRRLLESFRPPPRVDDFHFESIGPRSSEIVQMRQ